MTKIITSSTNLQENVRRLKEVFIRVSKSNFKYS